jgi:hypothetical protein
LYPPCVARPRPNPGPPHCTPPALLLLLLLTMRHPSSSSFHPVSSSSSSCTLPLHLLLVVTRGPFSSSSLSRALPLVVLIFIPCDCDHDRLIWATTCNFPLQRTRRSFPSFIMLSGNYTLTSSFPTPVFPCMLPQWTYKRTPTSQVLPSTILQFQGGPAGISLGRARAVSGASRSCVPMHLWLRSD